MAADRKLTVGITKICGGIFLTLIGVSSLVFELIICLKLWGIVDKSFLSMNNLDEANAFILIVGFVISILFIVLGVWQFRLAILIIKGKVNVRQSTRKIIAERESSVVTSDVIHKHNRQIETKKYSDLEIFSIKKII